MSAAATRLLLLALAILSLLVLTAVGAPLEAPPSDDGVLKLDNKSNGQPAPAKVGQTIQVKLEDDTTNPDFTITYKDLTSSNPAVVAPNNPDDGEPEGFKGTYNFKAISEGDARLTAVGVCKEADEAADPPKCPESADWKVTITVAAKEAEEGGPEAGVAPPP